MRDYSIGLFFKTKEDLANACKLLEENNIDADVNNIYSSLCICEAEYIFNNHEDYIVNENGVLNEENTNAYIYDLSNIFYETQDFINVDEAFRDEMFLDYLKENNLKLKNKEEM